MELIEELNLNNGRLNFSYIKKTPLIYFKGVRILMVGNKGRLDGYKSLKQSDLQKSANIIFVMFKWTIIF